MFGSTLVEPYVGELWIASIADLVMKDMANQNPEGMSELEMNQQLQDNLAGKNVDGEEAKMRQSKREVKIAMYLREKIQPVIDGSIGWDDFSAQIQMEAFKIADGSFGTTFLTMIGFQLDVESEEYIGFRQSIVDGYRAAAKKNLNATSNNFRITGAAIKAASAGRKVYKEVESSQQRAKADGKSAEDLEKEQAMLAAAKLEENLPAILELAWAINTRDVSRTLKNACKKLFADAGVDMDTRLNRAKAIKILGEEFLAVGKLVGKKKGDHETITTDDIKARAEIAVMTTMAKAQGQEVNDQDMEDMIRKHKEMSVQQKSMTSPTEPPAST